MKQNKTLCIGKRYREIMRMIKRKQEEKDRNKLAVRRSKWKSSAFRKNHTREQNITSKKTASDTKKNVKKRKKHTQRSNIKIVEQERCHQPNMRVPVRLFWFRLLSKSTIDRTIIQVAVVHKIESTANFSFGEQFMRSMMSRCLTHNSSLHTRID